MQVSLHSYSTSTGYHPTIKIVGFLARKFYKNYNTFSKERQLIVSHIFILIVTVQKEKTIIPFLDDTSPIWITLLRLVLLISYSIKKFVGKYKNAIEEVRNEQGKEMQIDF